MNQTACPAPETLAAFAELATRDAEREAVLFHVRACSDCYETFVETARLLRPDGFEDDDRAIAGVATGRVPLLVATPARPRGFRWPLALAASTILAFVAARVPAWLSAPVAVVRTSPPAPTPVAPQAPVVVAAADLPAWLDDAPWARFASPPLGFGPPSAPRQAFVAGMHLAALDRACRDLDGPLRTAAVARIGVSVQSARVFDVTEWRSLAARAVEGTCPPVAYPYAAPEWLGLGRTLEQWRIDALVGDPQALAPGRADDVRSALRTLLGGRERQKALALLAPPAADGRALASRLAALVELLCA